MQQSRWSLPLRNGLRILQQMLWKSVERQRGLLGRKEWKHEEKRRELVEGLAVDGKSNQAFRIAKQLAKEREYIVGGSRCVRDRHHHHSLKAQAYDSNMQTMFFCYAHPDDPQRSSRFACPRPYISRLHELLFRASSLIMFSLESLSTTSIHVLLDLSCALLPSISYQS